MAGKRLDRHCVQRVWGRPDLPGAFAKHSSDAGPIGEIWFADSDASDGDLLVKYLFTSQRLSIQVHPDDRAARTLGHPCGKDEAWLVLKADPGAVIGLGLTRSVSREELRRSALSGEIEGLIDWRPVVAGDFFYSPAGTIHAIGPGLVLVEVQQNLDLTYRLYDYGRPRELHLEDGIAVADPGPWTPPGRAVSISAGRQALAAGPAFVVERWVGRSGTVSAPSGRSVTIIPIAGSSRLDGRCLGEGSVWAVRGEARLDSEIGSDLLVAYSGSQVESTVLLD